MVICALCNGFYDKKFFKKHKNRCQDDAHVEACSVPMTLLEHTQTGISYDEFRGDILCKFRTTEVGDTARSDPFIVAVGKRLWQKGHSKNDKVTEVRKAVMSDMRRLASLYVIFKDEMKIHSTSESTNAGDMFQRKNFDVLSEAVRVYTTETENARIKAGRKTALFYLLKKSCKIIKATNLVHGKDDAAAEVDRFVSVLQLNHEFLFGDAIYQVNKN